MFASPPFHPSYLFNKPWTQPGNFGACFKRSSSSTGAAALRVLKSILTTKHKEP